MTFLYYRYNRTYSTSVLAYKNYMKHHSVTFIDSHTPGPLPPAQTERILIAREFLHEDRRLRVRLVAHRSPGLGFVQIERFCLQMIIFFITLAVHENGRHPLGSVPLQVK